MTGKELAPVSGKDLALIEDESPCPHFDSEVRHIVTEMWTWTLDKEASPYQKERAISAREGLLDELVWKAENGKWWEPMPEPDPIRFEEDTQILPGSVVTGEVLESTATWRLTDEEIARRFNDVVAAHLAWMDEQHQEALREIRGL